MNYLFSFIFFLFFPAVKTQSATVCVTAFISVFVETRCAFLLRDVSHEAVVSLGIAVGFGQGL